MTSLSDEPASMEGNHSPGAFRLVRPGEQRGGKREVSDGGWREGEGQRGLGRETRKGRRDTAGCKETEEKCQENVEIDEGRRNGGEQGEESGSVEMKPKKEI